MAVSVLIVDDYAPFRATVSELLRSRGLEVVGEAATCEGALSAARRLRPNAILLDICLPDCDGLSVVRELSAAGDGSRVLLTSSDPSVATDDLAKEHGAVGFIAKTDLVSADFVSYLA